MTEGPLRNVCLVGVGLHARHVYLEELTCDGRPGRGRLAVVVDVTEREHAVRALLAERNITPDHLLFVDRATARDRLPEAVARELAGLHAAGAFDGLVIATEPEQHLPYLMWAAAQGAPTMVDKPLTVTAFDPEDPETAMGLLEDYVRCCTAFAATGTRVSLMAERRGHPGYRFIHRLLHDTVEDLQVPITYLHAHHGHSVWNMPDEFFTRTNHPYTNGYGALMHGGYHLLDVAAWVLAANWRLGQRRPSATTLQTAHTTPADFFAQVPAPFYERFFGSDVRRWMTGDALAAARQLGETDLFVLWQLANDDGALTTAQLSVCESVHSTRAWRALPDDTYKRNGRVTHEEFSATCAHLVTVRAHDYRFAGSGTTSFELDVFRNAALVGGDRHTHYDWDGATLSNATTGEQVPPGRGVFAEWLATGSGPSELSEHVLTVLLHVLVARSMMQQRAGSPSTVSSRLPDRLDSEYWGL